MKKAIFFLALLFIIAIAVVYSLFLKSSSGSSPAETLKSETTEVLGSPEINKDVLIKEIIFNQDKFTAISIKVNNIENIILGSNTHEKYSSNEILDRLNCKVLVSGGFYTKENSPVGLFIDDGNLIKSFLTNTLFDGVFSINYLLTPRITRDIPKDNLKYAIQSGPVIVENSFAQNLSIKNDKPARRVVAATTGENLVVFIVLFDNNSRLLGPLLEDLPKILSIWQSESGISVADAINLDGGSASAFVSEEFTLTESSAIGSYFCVK